MPPDSTVFVELKPPIDTVGPIRDIVSFGIVEVTAFNPQAQPVTRFAEPVKICLTVPPQTEEEKSCLAFLNDDFEWECEDPCVSRETNDSGETLFCGNTDHFTNFAILLNPRNQGGRCDSTEDSNLELAVLIATIVSVSSAIILIIIGVILIEIRYQIVAYKLNKKLNKDIRSKMAIA